MPGGPWPDDGEAPYREEQDTDDGAGASAERADMIHYSHMVGEHPDLNSTAAPLPGLPGAQPPRRGGARGDGGVRSQGPPSLHHHRGWPAGIPQLAGIAARA